MRRRDFLKAAAASGAALAAQRLLRAQGITTRPVGASGMLPRRPFGKEGIKLSIIGFPGFALKELEHAQVQQVVEAAISRGVNYFDIAPEYGDSEIRLGPVLEPFRKDVFLACKTAKRDRAGAAADLKESLKRLRTDHFDLYQLHHVFKLKEDIDAVFAKGGAMEVLLEAKKAGVVRHLGFSAHTVHAALAAMDRFDFDSAMFAVNYASVKKGGFGPQILRIAREKGVTCIALKGLARQRWPKDDPRRQEFHRVWYQPFYDRREADLHLRYTLSQSVVAAIPPADITFLPLALDIAANFRPVTAAELQTLDKIATDWAPIFKA